MIRILHLAGSAVSDFYADLSRLYARDCLAATADANLYDVHIAYVAPDGRWRFPADLSDAAIAAAPAMDLPRALLQIETLGITLMVPQMFCIPGMTTYRAIFDLLAIPYLGNTPGAMALGLHKGHARAVVSLAGVDVPPGELVAPGQRPTRPPPVVVKPVDADNSLGVSLVTDPAGYDAALAHAFQHGSAALVETFVPLGREVRCGIIARGETLVCLPLEEYHMDPATKPIRDHGDKIAPDREGQPYLVAKAADRAWVVDPSDPITARVWEAARRCHTALGCRDYSLFDFRIDPDGRPWFLEASLYCSFARQSVLVVMAEAAGIPLRTFFDEAVQQALAVHTRDRPEAVSVHPILST